VTYCTVLSGHLSGSTGNLRRYASVCVGCSGDTSKLNDWEQTGSRQRRDQGCHHWKTRKYRNSVSASSYGVSHLSCVLWVNMYRAARSSVIVFAIN
jgi:hypothetical protein